MLASEVFGLYVIHRQEDGGFSAILAGEVIAPENFAAAQAHLGARPLHHALQTDHGGDGVGCPGGANGATSIKNQRGFFRQH